MPPLDVKFNDEFKKILKDKFVDWYADQVQNELGTGKSMEDVDVVLSTAGIKPTGSLLPLRK